MVTVIVVAEEFSFATSVSLILTVLPVSESHEGVDERAMASV